MVQTEKTASFEIKYQWNSQLEAYLGASVQQWPSLKA